MSDDAPTPEAAPPPASKQARNIGCLAAIVLLPAAVAGGWWWSGQQALRAQQEAAEAAFAPALEQMSEDAQATAEAEADSYDIDRTVRVIHGIDRALEEQEDLEGYLAWLSRQDYRGVSPEVLAARQEILGVLQELYGKQIAAEDQQAMWAFTTELLLSTLSVVEVGGDLGPTSMGAEFSVDRDQAREVLEDLQEKEAQRAALRDAIQELQAELFDAMVAYSEVYYGHLEEWDRLCTLRDRSYLAIRAGDWAAAQAAAQAAMEMAPHETEAHLLYALAVIEGGELAEDGPRVEAMLSEYIEEHPDRSAPALLLLGVYHQRVGDVAQAGLDFQQAASYYPRQADALTDMLDPYESRSWLRKTPEGGLILELYKETMLGAGYFSPDLQMARVRFESGDMDAWKEKVMDHFFRRRAQQQWDYLISDLRFCFDLFGERFREIFPQDSYLDLQVDSPMLGAGVELSVVNRSDRTLHNATLVLALQFPDMHPEDYEAVAVQPTQPAVMARQITDFGTLEHEFTLFGAAEPLHPQDAYQHRAILVANEGVMWLDTDEYKIAEAKEFRDARAERRASAWTEQVREQTVSAAQTGSRMSVEPSLGKDDVRIELPAGISIARPHFQLRYGGATFDPEENYIEDSVIHLGFEAIDDLEGGSRKPIELVAQTTFGELVLTWKPAGGGWQFGGVDVR